MHVSLKKSLWLVALPFAVMLLSGCTIPGTGIDIPIPFLESNTIEYENDILIIKSIRAIPEVVTPGQSLTVIAAIQNQGTEIIPKENVNVELYDYCPGLFYIPESELLKRPDGDLYPDQIVELRWGLKASNDVAVESKCPSDGMKVAVWYNYETDSLSTIAFIDEAEKNRRIQEGQYDQTSSSTTVGEGPIKAYIEIRDSQPIVSTSGTTNIVFQAQNKGNGFVKRSPESPLTPTVNWISATSSDATIKKGLDACMKEHESKFVLIGGQSAEIPCIIDVPDKQRTEYTETISTKIGYTYEFRKSVTVIVRPKK